MTDELTAIVHPAQRGADRGGLRRLSFGGYWAVKMALLRSDLIGVVNVGGPVHHTFDGHRLGQLPIGTRIALFRVLGLSLDASADEFAARLAELSLVKQALLPAERHSPLLSINGERDELVSIRDLHLMSEMGVVQDRLTFANDRHCASRNRPIHQRFVADWFAHRMEMN